jgi:hypothetical protein
VQQLSIFDFLENDEHEQQEGFFYTGGTMACKGGKIMFICPNWLKEFDD